MAIQYNRKEEILTRLEAQGLVQTMDSAEALQAMEAIDKHALEIRREYLEKERMSIIDARQFTFTA
jgi:hypothetical protein